MIEALWHEVICRNLYCLIDRLLDRRFFRAAHARLRQLVGDIDVLDLRVAGEHAQRGGIRGELIIGIGEIGRSGVLLIEIGHRVELPPYLRFDFGINFIEKRRIAAHLLP